MTEKKERVYEKVLEISATPEAVWRAVGDPQGIQQWFAPDIRVEPGVGGSIYAGWGEGMGGASRIEVWEPGKRLRYVFERPEGNPPNVVDFMIEGKAGSTTLRVVNSGFGPEARWDDEFETIGRAWPVFLALLKHSVERPHAAARNVCIFRMYDTPRGEIWRRLKATGELEPSTLDAIQRHFDDVGYAWYESRQLNGSPFGVFCEGGASTMLTLMWILYDQPDERADAILERWSMIADGLSKSAAPAG